MNKRKLIIIKDRVFNKIKSLTKVLKKLNTKRVVLLVVFLVLIFSLGYLGVSIFKQYKVVNDIKGDIVSVGSDIQLGYHRVFNLTDSMELVDHSEFKKDCEEFSFDCLYTGNTLKEELLNEIKQRSFSDRDIEILNMISSIQVSTNENESRYNQLIGEYSDNKQVFPFKLIGWLFKDLKALE